MGNQQSISNTISETINNSMTNVMMKSSQNCTQTNVASQIMNFEGITAREGCSLSFTGIKQEAKQSPNFTCAMSSANSSELSNALKSQLQQDAAAKVSGVGGALNSQAISTTITNTINNIATNVDVSQVANCVQDNLAEQTMNFQKIEASCPTYCRNPQLCKGVESLCDFSKCEVKFADIEQNMVQEAVASCLSENATVQKAVNDITTEVKQTTTSEAKGVDPAALFSSSILPSLIITCIILSSAAFLFMGGMGGKPGENPLKDKMMEYAEGKLDSAIGTSTSFTE